MRVDLEIKWLVGSATLPWPGDDCPNEVPVTRTNLVKLSGCSNSLRGTRESSVNIVPLTDVVLNCRLSRALSNHRTVSDRQTNIGNRAGGVGASLSALHSPGSFPAVGFKLVCCYVFTAGAFPEREFSAAVHCTLSDKRHLLLIL